MSGENVSDIESSASEAFNAGHREDFEFDASDVIQLDGKNVVFVSGVFPGGVTLVDPDGRMVLADQKERMINGVVDGTYVSVDGFLENGALQGTWRIRYNRGRRGADAIASGTSTASSEELMMYALIFG